MISDSKVENIISDDLLKIVCCPNCQGNLSRKDGSDVVVVCDDCKTSFRMKDGVLVLISKELEEELRFG